MALTDYLEDETISIEDKLIAIRGYLDNEKELNLSNSGQKKLLDIAKYYSQYKAGISDDVDTLLDELFEFQVNPNQMEYSQSGFRNEINKILEKYS